MDLPLILIFVFSIIGILDALYMAYHRIKGTDVKCVFFPDKWCRKVQHSKYSRTFGIPNSFAGFFVYLLILILTWLYYVDLITFLLSQLIISVGFLFSLYLMFIQAKVLKAFCTWCVLSFINFLIMFISMWFI